MVCLLSLQRPTGASGAAGRVFHQNRRHDCQHPLLAGDGINTQDIVRSRPKTSGKIEGLLTRVCAVVETTFVASGIGQRVRSGSKIIHLTSVSN